MSATTHLAGPAVCIQGRIIQRCAICGEKLLDLDPARFAVAETPESRGETFTVWQAAAYVEIEGNRSSMTGTFPCDEVPENFCLVLVEF